MNDKNANGRTSNFRVATVGVGALILGLLGGTLVPTNGAFGQHEKAVIVMDGQGVCRQYVNTDAGRVKDAYPRVYRPSLFPPTFGDVIAWTGVKPDGTMTRNVDVVFPPDATPFAKRDFHNGEETSKVVKGAPAGDFSFATVTIDGTQCSAFSDPGVHVDR